MRRGDEGFLERGRTRLLVVAAEAERLREAVRHQAVLDAAWALYAKGQGIGAMNANRRAEQRAAFEAGWFARREREIEEASMG